MYMRRGSGRLKHVEVQDLWLQGAVQGNKLRVEKIPRNVNIEDALTHHWVSSSKYLPGEMGMRNLDLGETNLARGNTGAKYPISIVAAVKNNSTRQSTRAAPPPQHAKRPNTIKKTVPT